MVVNTTGKLRCRCGANGRTSHCVGYEANLLPVWGIIEIGAVVHFDTLSFEAQLAASYLTTRLGWVQ
jgi:hypothetical protein